MKGIFYGVSVGPGDPEYLTLKAVRILQQCQVIAAPRTDGVSSAALEIARGAVDFSQKEIIYLDFLMVRDKARLAEQHKNLTALVAQKLEKGQDVAMPNLGDCSLYASYGYLRDQLEALGYETQAIAGVTSFCACAARLGVSLTQARLPLRILPGDYPNLAEELALPGTAVVMKSGKGLEKVRKAIESSGRQGQARIVENCGMTEERIPATLQEASGGYFSTILVDAVDNTKKGKRQMQEKDRAILAVSFGTSHRDALQNSIQAIEHSFQAAFPAVLVVRAFTSGMIMKKLRERDGLAIDSPAQALTRLAQQGVRHVTVQPTHMIAGDEYEKLAAVCEAYRSQFDSLVIGAPLLSQREDFTQVVQAVCGAYPAPKDTALVLMGHGSESKADEAYQFLWEEFRRQGYRHVFVGTVESQPDGPAVLEQVQAAGYEKAILAPLMVVAGDHAKNDMAGGEEDSWNSLFEAAGIQTRCILHGLGEVEDIRKMYTSHLQNVMKP